MCILDTLKMCILDTSKMCILNHLMSEKVKKIRENVRNEQFQNFAQEKYIRFVAPLSNIIKIGLPF